MVVKKVASFYTLNQLRKTLRHAHRTYRRKMGSLDASAKQQIEAHLHALQTALDQKDVRSASRIGKQLEDVSRKLMPKSFWDRTRDFLGAILFALCAAILIRTMWFEPYTIPTGSMRPTLKEGDFLVVSKTDYGINVPLRSAQFYFDPSLVQRGDIFVFSGDQMDIQDADTTYFYLFPGKKLFVKRLMGKPGDTLYFYGGQIYGIDAQGKEITDLRYSPWARSLEHIPFIRFDGKVSVSDLRQGVFHAATFYQMNRPVAKLSVGSLGQVQGEVLSERAKAPLAHYSDLWGLKNYAMARLLSPAEADQLHPGLRSELGSGMLYLELSHHPSILGGKIIRDESNRLRPDLSVETSLMALNPDQVQKIALHLTTARFIVEKGVAYRYGMTVRDPASLPYLPKLPGVPDGTYEIQNGTAYQVLWGNFTKKLPAEHPLYNRSAERVQTLYNLGIEFLHFYSPGKNNALLPSRYAYFREGDLYLLGAPIVAKSAPEMTLFLKREYTRQAMSTSVHPYLPFDDEPPPLSSNGEIDKEFIRKYGFTIPDNQVLALGDNHAMSGDSRQFGCVPDHNIRGRPFLLFWPPGERWGRLPQPIHSFFTFPNLFIWISAGAITAAFFYINRNTKRKK